MSASSRLPRCETSWGAAQGQCAVWLNADTLCSRPLGHLVGDLPHRGYDPYGSGRWVEYDDHAREVRRGGPWAATGGPVLAPDPNSTI